MSIILEGLNDSDTSSDEDSAGGDDSEQTPSTYLHSIGGDSEVTQWFNGER